MEVRVSTAVSPFQKGFITASSFDAVAGSNFSLELSEAPKGNLLGTIRTLDTLGPVDLNCSANSGLQPRDESLHCAWGLPSTQGWFVFNDTASPRFAPSSDWPQGSASSSGSASRPPTESETGRHPPLAFASPNGTDSLDVYISMHGSDYAGALQSFALVTGRTPMPARAPLDVMWCRWYDIGADEAVDVARQHALRSL